MAGAPFYVKYAQRALTCERPKHVLIVGKEIVGLRIMTCITVRVADIIGTNDVGTGKYLGIKSVFIYWTGQMEGERNLIFKRRVQWTTLKPYFTEGKRDGNQERDKGKNLFAFSHNYTYTTYGSEPVCYGPYGYGG